MMVLGGLTVTYLAVEPHLILPLLWLARLHVLGIVVVNQVDILDIPVESCFIETHCDKTAGCIFSSSVSVQSKAK